MLTLSIQEIADGHRVVLFTLVPHVLKHLIELVALRAEAHVLLAQRSHMVANVGALLETSVSLVRRRLSRPLTYQLFRQRDLLELHLVDPGGCGPQQRSGCDDAVGLHAVAIFATSGGFERSVRRRKPGREANADE